MKVSSPFALLCVGGEGVTLISPDLNPHASALPA